MKHTVLRLALMWILVGISALGAWAGEINGTAWQVLDRGDPVVLFARQGPIFVATILAYTSSGAPTWLAAVGTVDGERAEGILILPSRFSAFGTTIRILFSLGDPEGAFAIQGWTPAVPLLAVGGMVRIFP